MMYVSLYVLYWMDITGYIGFEFWVLGFVAL